jgi:hypothetical protein
LCRAAHRHIGLLASGLPRRPVSPPFDEPSAGVVRDTNIPTPPADAAIEPLYAAPLGTGEFWEVDRERGCVMSATCAVAQGGETTFMRSNKIDYVFASRWHMYVPMGQVVVNRNVGECGEQQDTLTCSDHYIMHSQVILPFA